MSSDTRRYSSSLRTRQAAETRGRILDAAAESFSANGYAGTTLAAIAQRAGVSVETVQNNGPKRALLLASFERTFTGAEGPRLISEQPVGRSMLDVQDLDEFIRGLVTFVAEANARTDGLWRAFVSASDSDPEVRSTLDDLLVRRRQDMVAAIEALTDRGAAIADPARAADLLSFLLSPEGYHQLVIRAGWPTTAYTDWLHTAVRRLG